MAVIKTKPSWMPKCPNHGATLEGLPNPIPMKGNGMCPVTGVMFAYEVDAAGETHKMVKDKNGNLVRMPEWKMTGDETKVW